MTDNFYSSKTIAEVRTDLETNIQNILAPLLDDVNDETTLNFLSAVLAGWSLDNVEINTVGTDQYV